MMAINTFRDRFNSSNLLTSLYKCDIMSLLKLLVVPSDIQLRLDAL